MVFFLCFCVCLFLILIFNNFQKLCPQKLINTFSWVISYLLFFQMCGFELLLLGKNQKVFKVQATLMNTLWVQCIPGHLIGWLFFQFYFQEIRAFFGLYKVLFWREVKIPHIAIHKGLLDIIDNREI